MRLNSKQQLSFYKRTIFAKVANIVLVAGILGGCQQTSKGIFIPNPWAKDPPETSTSENTAPSVEGYNSRDSEQSPTNLYSDQVTETQRRAHENRIDRLNEAAENNPYIELQEIFVKPGQAPDEIWEGEHPVVRVSYKDKVFFDFDRFSLTSAGKSVLGEFWEFLEKEPVGTKVLIVGHTDSKGLDVYNQKLSEKRALEVLNHLSDRKHVQFKYSGMGETQPVATNATAKDRSLNRRVEFFLSAHSQANSRALADRPFDPCNWNNHPGALENEGSVPCSLKSKRDGVIIKSQPRNTPGATARADRVVSFPKAQLEEIEKADRRAQIIISRTEREQLRKGRARAPLNMMKRWKHSTLPKSVKQILKNM